MTIDFGDADRSAQIVFEMAGASAADPPGTAALAVKLLGRNCIRRRLLMKTPAALARAEDRWLIFLRCGLTPAEEAFLVGHELAEWFYRCERGPAIEDACDALGAALVAPAPAFLSVLRQIGPDYSRLGRAFVASHSLIAMRVAETTGRPTALVTPGRVRRRGVAYEFGPDEAVRAQAAARRTRPGLKRSRLSDDRRRVVLTA